MHKREKILLLTDYQILTNHIATKLPFKKEIQQIKIQSNCVR